jgi:hypothetical protein
VSTSDWLIAIGFFLVATLTLIGVMSFAVGLWREGERVIASAAITLLLAVSLIIGGIECNRHEQHQRVSEQGEGT